MSFLWFIQWPPLPHQEVVHGHACMPTEEEEEEEEKKERKRISRSHTGICLLFVAFCCWLPFVHQVILISKTKTVLSRPTFSKEQPISLITIMLASIFLHRHRQWSLADEYRKNKISHDENVGHWSKEHEQQTATDWSAQFSQRSLHAR